MTRKAVAAVLLAAVGIAAQPAHGQGGSATNYPQRPIRLIVGFPPGGATDILARILSQHMPDSIGQPVVVDNRSGATGTVAAAIAAKAPPDGYTIMMVPSGPYTISASTYTNVIVVPQASPAKTLQDLIRMAREKPGQITFSSAGPGSLHHLSGEVMKRLTGTDMIHVPFKGAGPAMTAMAGAEVNFGFTSMPSAMPLISANRIRPLAVTSMKRMPALPDTPTMAEAGLPPPPGLDIREWYGVIVPVRTPAAIVDRLNAEMVKVFQRPDVQKRLTEMGAEYVGSSPQELSKQLANDVRLWAKWVKDTGVRVE
jgi:tripartite-type tricarboxylate transporter receptor subunit TctC